MFAATGSTDAGVKPEKKTPILVKQEFAASTPSSRGRDSGETGETGIHQSFTVLKNISESTSIERLQKASEICREVLRGISSTLYDSVKSEYLDQQLTKVHTLTGIEDNSQFILGIVGSTGVGKSSLVNTLLGGDDLVPTDCALACTSVVTEISYNDSEAEDELYQAKVAYIDPVEWKAELELLRADICTVDEDSEETVFLMADPDICELLGTTQHIRASNIDEFRGTLNRYVNSRDKSQSAIDIAHAITILSGNQDGSNDTRGTNHPHDASLDDSSFGADHEIGHENTDEHLARYQGSSRRKKKMALWPLIRVVRIHTKADILSSGLVLVDLLKMLTCSMQPGVQDSNAARDAVASQYLQKCHAVWVVADITRAAADKAAQNLLTKRFKQQLRLDGNIENLTLVCTKTDHIIPEVAWEQFDLHRQHEKWTNAQKSKTAWEEQHLQELQQLDQRCTALGKLELEITRRTKKWDSLLVTVQAGKKAEVPRTRARKRKAPDAPPTSNKRHSGPNVESGAGGMTQENMLLSKFYASAEDVWEKLANSPATLQVGTDVSLPQARSMLQHLQSIAEITAKEAYEVDRKTFQLNREKIKLNNEMHAQLAQLRLECIKARNSVVKEAVRRDFQRDLEESAPAKAWSKNGEAYGSGAGSRNNRSAGFNLSVFCVSTLEYKRTEDDELLHVTEIPQLKNHALNLTKQNRIRRGRQFVTDVLEVLNSLQIWACDQVWFNGGNEQRRYQSLDEAAFAFTESCKDTLEKSILHKLRGALHKFSVEAIEKAGKWPVAKDNRLGLPYATYAAVCRRNAELTIYSGVFSGALGEHDFNEDLVSPLKSYVEKNWSTTFSTAIPQLIEEFVDKSMEHQNAFHKIIVEDISPSVSAKTLKALEAQLKARNTQLNYRSGALTDVIKHVQREASRRFTPPVANRMKKTYERVMGVNGGKGKFTRMKETMSEQVRAKAFEMLISAHEALESEFASLASRLDQCARSCTAKAFRALEQDYTNVLGGNHLKTKDDIETIAETKEKLRKVLSTVDEKFAAVAIELADDDQPVGPEDQSHVEALDDDEDSHMEDSEDDSDNEEPEA
ncbi:uncharacterized protein B0I36DRAFT_428435 [Microdochium trichocladiopsis]|uniref:Nuclear GTPase SLIP-GC n=1 Tax=Microdochium trichocladiopsis TaxID=1682393 RepID=A0A9P8YFE1_9PEZI|nr:uncharacterized protein B0I36DRAFT_428435 [Microdochium trichocladiopsis]KAH7037892.1 hypothetical protein B0I36DRAFT_428435 [Microdochium trichocladiopsis]